MMSYTRLYLEPTEVLMGQARTKRLPRLLNQQRENMGGVKLILYHYSIKGQETRIQKVRKQVHPMAIIWWHVGVVYGCLG